MSIHQRRLDLPKDLPEALDLADVSALGIPHVADWPYRFSSWALNDPLNTRAWFSTSSRLLGWTVMQTPFWAIDCIVHPDAPSYIYKEMLEWAQSRAVKMAALGEGRPMWFVSIPSVCLDQRRDLTTLGFEDASKAGEDAWSKVLFELVGNGLPAPVRLPEGLRIRSFDSGSDLEAYVDVHRKVFRSDSMTPVWRNNLTRVPGYRNTLDLVVSSGEGELYGFCVSWLRQLVSGETVGQIEPLGVHESHRGQKLGWSLLAEAIRRLRSQGASRIYVETDRQRSTAMATYASLGFNIAHEVLVYRWVAG